MDRSHANVQEIQVSQEILPMTLADCHKSDIWKALKNLPTLTDDIYMPAHIF